MIELEQYNFTFIGHSTGHTLHIAIDPCQLGEECTQDEFARFLDEYEQALNHGRDVQLFAVKEAKNNQVAGTWLCAHWGDTGADCESILDDDLTFELSKAWAEAVDVVFC